MTTMETRDFAERILFGAALTDKLVAPERLTDAQPGRAIDLPDAPARPPGLGFLEAEGKQRTRFPKAGAMANDQVRGRVLHFFANHELLALELMALMLLRFPDAPAGFRRGLVQTMRDEQTHLSLYLERMQALGVGFGEVGVNSFFWRCIADVETPADFAARMSLTFEQANLDFTLHYTQLFRTLGDDATADVLDIVLADEVRHVKHGLIWFDRWKPPHVTLWDAYVGHLRFPLSPARAKAFSFSRELRTRAGLPDDYIDTLEVYAHSKGKRPTLFTFNPDCESQIAHGEPGRNPNKHVLARILDLETLPMFLAGPDDIVLVREAPRTDYLAHLQRQGAVLPEFVTSTAALSHRTLEATRPWGWSPDTAALLGPVQQQVRDDRQRPPDALFTPAIEALYAKTSWPDLLADVLADEPDASWLIDPIDVGAVCHSPAAVDAHAAHLRAHGCGIVAVKAPIGTSGRQLIRLMPGVTEPNHAIWLDRALARHGAVVVEPWRDNVCDLSMQLEVAPDGAVNSKGLGRFLTDGRGRYIGAVVRRMTAGLPRDVARFFNDDGRDTTRVERLMNRVAERVGERCYAAGYTGPVGIDAMVLRLPTGQLRLKPLLEVNPRTTMGQLALALRRFVPKHRAAVWRHFGLREVRDAGYDGFVDFHAAIAERAWTLATNDPQRARACLSVLLVADRWDDLPPEATSA